MKSLASTLILWDIDGTLLLTGGAGKIAFNRIFLDLFGEADIWNNINPDGRTDYSLIKECYETRFKRAPQQYEIEKIKAAYEKVFYDELKIQEKFRLMPHVKETLDKLSCKPDVVLGLATGNFKIPAYDKLRHAGLDHHFSFGGFGCDSEDRLELTQKAVLRGEKLLGKKPEKIFVIGDSVHDVRCGKSIGAKVIAVCTGSTPGTKLKDAGANFVLKDLSELDYTKL